MSRVNLHRYLPEPERLLQARGLRFLRPFLGHPALWHMNRRSAAGAMFWGLYCTFLPLPVQMGAAALAAVCFRVNLPLCVALVWLSNPLTVVPILYYSYVLGCHLLLQPVLNAAGLQALLLDCLHALLGPGHALPAGEASQLLWPLLLGSQVAGVAAGLSGYGGLRLYWRWHVVRAWRRRGRQTVAAR